MKRMSYLLLSIAVCLLTACSSEINAAKNLPFPGHEGTTFGKVLENYDDCSDKKWSREETSQGERFVEFTCVVDSFSSALPQLRESADVNLAYRLKNSPNLKPDQTEEGMSVEALKEVSARLLIQWPVAQDGTLLENRRFGRVQFLWPNRQKNASLMTEWIYSNRPIFVMPMSHIDVFNNVRMIRGLYMY